MEHYVVAKETIDKIARNMCDLFIEYEHNYTQDGVMEILRVWLDNNQNLLDTLSRHPNWDAESLAVVFPHQFFHRGIDKEEIFNFQAWCREKTFDMFIGKEIKYNGMSYSELYDKKTTARELKTCWSNVLFYDHNAKINGKFSSIEEINECIMEMNNAIRSIRSFPCWWLMGHELYFCKEYFEKIRSYTTVIDMLCDVNGQFLSEKDAEEFNKWMPDLKAKAGQKFSRLIGKFGKLTGFDQIKEIDPNNGRDYGWNRRFAMVADSINPINYERITLISVNPLDYLTMSFGHGWASCHTIDAHNKRNGSHAYHGMYMSGTMSYMLDSSSVIVYTIDNKYEGKDFWNQDKINRCVFCLGKEKLLQSRCYPDGRSISDGEEGDATIADQFRDVFQRTVAECWNVPNLWEVRRGSEYCMDYTRSYGTHYKDYVCYEDGVMCFLKGSEDKTYIDIGHNPICPYCGEEHDKTESLCCFRHIEIRKCAVCGETLNANEGIDIRGRFYCDESCAFEAGYVLTEDEGWQRQYNCRQDSYSLTWYYYWEGGISLTDSNGNNFYYLNADHAEKDDCINLGDRGWYKIYDTEICSECGEICPKEDLIDGMCHCCLAASFTSIDNNTAEVVA